MSVISFHLNLLQACECLKIIIKQFWKFRIVHNSSITRRCFSPPFKKHIFHIFLAEMIEAMVSQNLSRIGQHIGFTSCIFISTSFTWVSWMSEKPLIIIILMMRDFWKLNVFFMKYVYHMSILVEYKNADRRLHWHT